MITAVSEEGPESFSYHELSLLEQGVRFRAAYESLAAIPNSSISDALRALARAGIANAPSEVIEETHFTAEAQRDTTFEGKMGPLTQQEQLTARLLPALTEEI